MGRDTWFYKVDKCKAKEYLLPFLEESNYNGLTFENFLKERNDIHEQYNQIVSPYNEILNCIATDFNWIKASALFEIVWYIEDFHRAVDRGNNKIDPLIGLGITELYYMRKGYGIMFQYGDYNDIFEMNMIDEGNDGANIDANDFKKFADYLMLLGELIAIDSKESNEISPDVVKELEGIKEKNMGNDNLFNLLKNEFSIIKRDYDSAIADNPQNTRSSPTVELYFNSYLISHSFYDIKRALLDINTRLIIVDSI